MAKWNLSVEEAFAQLLLWAHSAEITRARILAPEPETSAPSRQVDAQLFAMTVRQVLRFAELCRAVAPKPMWSVMDKARNAFLAISPDAESIRNVLDHWDDYLRGDGTEFPARPLGHVGRPDLQLMDRPTNFVYEHGGGTYRLHITPAPGARTLILDVERDATAVHKLVQDIGDALPG
jgi:hypothetical protein